MTAEQRSLLVLKLDDIDNPHRDRVCTIEGLSTKTKDHCPKDAATQFGTKPLKVLLQLAESFAVFLGCTKLRLFDAANAVELRNNEAFFVFLTRITLLRENLCFYEKYGFSSDKILRLPSLASAKDVFRGSLAIRVLLYRSKTWQEVYEKLRAKANYPEAIDEFYEGLGMQLESMQTWFSKSPSASYSFDIHPSDEPFLESYSDRWMDVY